VRGNIEVIRMLLRAGADCTRLVAVSKTPLDIIIPSPLMPADVKVQWRPKYPLAYLTPWQDGLTKVALARSFEVEKLGEGDILSNACYAYLTIVSRRFFQSAWRGRAEFPSITAWTDIFHVTCICGNDEVTRELRRHVRSKGNGYGHL
jgi:hypothetical protein